MSDWGATHDAIAAANGGLDLEMPSAIYMTPETLRAALQQGTVSMATIDDKVRRILRKVHPVRFSRSRPARRLHRSATTSNPIRSRTRRRSRARCCSRTMARCCRFDKAKAEEHRDHRAGRVPGGESAAAAAPRRRRFAPSSFLEGISDALRGTEHNRVL